MSIVSKRARVASVAVSSVLIASCAAPTSMSDTRREWQRKTAPPAFVATNDDRPPMILPETYFAAARLFESQGDYAKAAHQYRSAVAVDHDFTDAFHRLGLVHSLLGERELAIEALARAVELRPTDSTMRNNLGFEFILAERWEDAGRELTKATLLKPGFVRAHINLGIAHSRMQRFDEALASFRRVLPETDAQYNLGLMYRGQKRYDDAYAAFERVLDLDPEFTVAWEQLRQIQDRITRNTKGDSKNESQAPVKAITVADQVDVPNAPAAKAPMAVPVDKVEPPAKVIEPADPLELADETAGLTPSLDFLLALVDRQRECEQESISTQVNPARSRILAEMTTRSADFDENGTDEFPNMFSEDMPDDVASSHALELSFLPDDFASDSPALFEDPWDFVCLSEFVYPEPVIASAADFVAADGFLEEDCDDFRLVDELDDASPWFRVPTPRPFVAKRTTVEIVSDRFDRQPGPSPVNLVSPKTNAGSAPSWSEPVSVLAPSTEAFGPIASVDAFAALREFELELAQVREEIRCLESLDEEPSHMNFVVAKPDSAPQSDNAVLEIPAPLDWMLDRMAAEMPLSPFIVAASDGEMGPPAPSHAIMTPSRQAPVNATRAKLTASKIQPRKSRNANDKGHKAIQTKNRNVPVKKNKRGNKRPDATKPLTDATDMHELDGLLSIVFNELDCLDGATSNRSMQLHNLSNTTSFDSSGSITWPYLNINDSLMVPGNVLPFEASPFGMRSRRHPSPVPGLAPSSQPRGKYGHEITGDGR